MGAEDWSWHDEAECELRQQEQLMLPGMHHYKPVSALKPNSLIFTVANGKEMLRLEEDGSFYVQGRKTAVDLEIYVAFREWWLLQQGISAENTMLATTTVEI